MNTYPTYPTRLDMVKDLPGPRIGAEVGVQRGEFSAQILPYVDRLFLIDLWFKLDGENSKDPAALDQGGHDANFRHVMERFREAVILGIVSIHRLASHHAVSMFAFHELSFVFIDADHRYEKALQDLELWSQTIRPGGCLLVHDYVDNEKSRAMGFGVVQAVDEFCRNEDWKITAITAEEWPTVKLERA